MNCCLFLPFMVGVSLLRPCLTAAENSKAEEAKPPQGSHPGLKTGWIWNQYFVEEEMNVTKEITKVIGRLSSNMHNGSNSLKYKISGDGAGSIFFINGTTGVLSVAQKLDREKQAFYNLKAHLIDITTGQAVESESEFVVKVTDINDNEPKFLQEPYEAVVPEMSPEGTFIIQVTASDADDPLCNNNARLVYELLQGQPYFSIEPTTGVIRTSSKMDRELQDSYWVIVQAKDRIGLPGALSGTTRVLITLSDINDNIPIFKTGLYRMNVSESAPIGTSVGIIMAHDRDIGENAEMDYSIENDDSQTFDIITNNETQEGIVILKKKVDYEQQAYYHVRAKVKNRHVDEQLKKYHTVASTTLIRVRVEDEDEPPVFLLPYYVLEIFEESPQGSLVGVVSAIDPDDNRCPIRYSISKSNTFQIDDNGTITTTHPLDREMRAWWNFSITATELYNEEQTSEVPVYIQVLDINDHAPEFPELYKTYVCENASSGQEIQTISAVDKDDSIERPNFYFNLSVEDTENSKFTIRDNQDNTAVILTNRTGFSLQEETVFYIFILIADNGVPSLTSTNMLTIQVCDCGDSGSIEICHNKDMLFMESRTEIITAILICAVIILLLGFIFMILHLQQRKKQTLFPEKDKECKESIVRYDDGGTREEDTEASAIGELRCSTFMREPRTRKTTSAEIRSLCRMSWQVGPDDAVIKEFILEKLEEANTDTYAHPLDSLQIYAFEGTGSLAGSLSSLESSVSGENENFDCFHDLELPFQI